MLTNIPRLLVRSSNLKSVGYDHTTHTLDIEFHSGGVYRYYGVPSAVHSGLVSARSLGTFFHEYIKDQFEFDELI